MRFTEKQLRDKKKNGRIRGYQVAKQRRDHKGGNVIPKQKPAAILWLDLNLQYWCNDRALTLDCAANGGEHRFDTQRKFRFDYAIQSIKVAVEFEGGIFMQKSGHNTAKHYTKDTEKYNLALQLGWMVIRVTAMNYKTAPAQLTQLYNQRLNIST